jgi:hypothetical protein
VILPAATAAAQESYQRVRSEDGKCSVEVPASWTVTVLPPKPGALLQFDATVEGVKDTILGNVWHLEGQRDVLEQLAREYYLKGSKGDARATAVPDPIPHLLLEFSDYVEVTAYAMSRRNGVNTQMCVDPSAWPDMRDTFLHMARSLEVDLEEWPSHPARFRREPKNGFIYLVDPSVRGKDLAALQAVVLDVARAYEKAHGTLVLPDENPPIVVVCNTLREAKAIWPDVDTDLTADNDNFAGRIFVTPVPQGRNKARADCAKAVHRLLHVQRYGSFEPYWMYVGEGHLVWSETLTGLAPPRLADSLHEDIPSPPVTFQNLVAMSEMDDPPKGFSDHAISYALLFTAGPEKYRKAYDAFKTTLAATHDAKKAHAELLALDQGEMKADLEKWLRKSVRSVETK